MPSEAPSVSPQEICSAEGGTSLSKQKASALREGFSYGWAATYFPTFHCSIIGTAGLNFSVRNGKRCTPASQPPRVSLGLWRMKERPPNKSKVPSPAMAAGPARVFSRKLSGN